MERKIIVSVSLSYDVINKLDSMANKENRSRAEVMRTAIDSFLKQKQIVSKV